MTMRKILLSSNDFSLFGHEISPADYKYFIDHKDAFRRMWTEQGQKFWFIYLITFKKFAKKNILPSPMPQLGEDVQVLSDIVFKSLITDFTLGKQNQAKRLIDDIIMVAKNRHCIQYLDSKSLAKDPFYHKDTRDSFRSLFGEPNDRVSYAKVYLYLVMYLKFGGSVMECLRLWLKADEWTPSVEEKCWCIPHYEQGEFDMHIDGYILYLMERNHGCRFSPLYIENWTMGNPRLYEHEENPLFDEKWDCEKDWRDNMQVDLFEKFMAFILAFQRETQNCMDCNRECNGSLPEKEAITKDRKLVCETQKHCLCGNSYARSSLEVPSNTTKKKSKKARKTAANRNDKIRDVEKRAKALELLKDLAPRELLTVGRFPEFEMYPDEDFVCTDDEYETVDEDYDSLDSACRSIEHSLDSAIDVLLNPPTGNLPHFSLDTPRCKNGAAAPDKPVVVANSESERGEDDKAVITKNQVTKSVSDIASIVNDMAERVHDVVTRVNNFAAKTNDGEGQKAKDTVELLQNSVKRAKEAVGKAQGSVEKNETVDKAKDALMDAIAAMKIANDLTGKAADTVEKWRGYIGIAQDTVGKANETIEKNECTIRQTRDTIEKARDKMIKTQNEIEHTKKVKEEIMKEYVIPLTDEELMCAIFGERKRPNQTTGKVKHAGSTDVALVDDESQTNGSLSKRARKRQQKKAQKESRDVPLDQITLQHRQYLDEGLRSMLPPGLIPETQQIIDASLPLSDADIGRTVSIATEDKITHERLVYTISFPRPTGQESNTTPEAMVHVSKDVENFTNRKDWSRASDCLETAETMTAAMDVIKLNGAINDRIKQRVLAKVEHNCKIDGNMKQRVIEEVEKQVFREVLHHARNEVCQHTQKDLTSQAWEQRNGTRPKTKATLRLLRKCANCSKEEIVAKEFKKCQKCKEVASKDTRYYCGRDCQVIDWKAKHRKEHLDNSV